MFGKLFKKEKKDNRAPGLYAFATGTVVSIEEVPDEVFSTKMLGEGIAIQPAESLIVSPCSGVITTLMADSKHAVGIKTDDGLDILIHVGLDTVGLNGEGFKYFIKDGERVSTGDSLISYDKAVLDKNNLSDITMLVVPEAGDKTLSLEGIGNKVTAGQELLIKY